MKRAKAAWRACGMIFTVILICIIITTEYLVGFFRSHTVLDTTVPEDCVISDIEEHQNITRKCGSILDDTWDVHSMEPV